MAVITTGEKPDTGHYAQCLDCDGLTPQHEPDDQKECVRCGSDVLQNVRLEDCPHADDDEACEDEAHDFGVGMHVARVE